MPEEIRVEMPAEPEANCKSTSNPARKFTSILSGNTKMKDADHYGIIFVIQLIFSSYTFSLMFEKYTAFPNFIRAFPEMILLSFIVMLFSAFLSCHYAIRCKTLAYLYFSIFASAAGFFCTMLITILFGNFDFNSLPGIFLFCGIGYYTARTNTLGVFFMTLVFWEIMLISSLSFSMYVDYDWSDLGLTLTIVFVIWCLLGLLFCFPSFVTVRRRVLHDIIGCVVLPLNMMYNCQIAERANQQLTFEDREELFYGLAMTCVFVEAAVLFLIIRRIVNRCQEDLEEETLE